MKHVLACHITRTWSRYELVNYYKLNYVFKKVDWNPSQRMWGAYRYKTPVSCASTATSALNNSRIQSGKTIKYTGWVDRSKNDVVTGLLFLINSTYALLCEQQIEVSSRRPLNRKKRKCSIEQLSIISNSHAVISKGRGGGVVMLFIREAEGKLQLNDANKRRIVATRFY